MQPNDIFNTMTKAFNLEALQQLTQRNLDAFKKANAIVVEGFSQVASRQGQQAQSWMQQCTEAAKSLSSAKGIEDLMQQQSTFMKGCLERSMANNQEIADIARRTQAAAADVLSSSTTTMASEWQQAATTAWQQWSQQAQQAQQAWQKATSAK